MNIDYGDILNRVEYGGMQGGFDSVRRDAMYESMGTHAPYAPLIQKWANPVDNIPAEVDLWNNRLRVQKDRSTYDTAILQNNVVKTPWEFQPKELTSSDIKNIKRKTALIDKWRRGKEEQGFMPKLGNVLKSAISFNSVDNPNAIQKYGFTKNNPNQQRTNNINVSSKANNTQTNTIQLEKKGFLSFLFNNKNKAHETYLQNISNGHGIKKNPYYQPNTHISSVHKTTLRPGIYSNTNRTLNPSTHNTHGTLRGVLNGTNINKSKISNNNYIRNSLHMVNPYENYCRNNSNVSNVDAQVQLSSQEQYNGLNYKNSQINHFI